MRPFRRRCAAMLTSSFRRQMAATQDAATIAIFLGSVAVAAISCSTTWSAWHPFGHGPWDRAARLSEGATKTRCSQGVPSGGSQSIDLVGQCSLAHIRCCFVVMTSQAVQDRNTRRKPIGEARAQHVARVIGARARAAASRLLRVLYQPRSHVRLCYSGKSTIACASARRSWHCSGENGSPAFTTFSTVGSPKPNTCVSS